MLLSEAIREGAKIRPQGYGTMFEARCDVSEEFEGVASCALGAAYEAKHHEYRLAGLSSMALYSDFPILSTVVTPPCACFASFVGEDLRDTVTHLNDFHDWRREAIADWVQHFEAGAADPRDMETYA